MAGSGPELVRGQAAHTLRIEMTPDDLEARARHEFDVVRAEMVRIARSMWPAVRGAEAVPDR